MSTESLNCATSKDLRALKNTRIFVAGDVILDSYIEGKASRISPEAPVPILLETGRKYVPGGAGNVAANIASIGAHVQICARVGEDPEALILKKYLESFGVNAQSLISQEHAQTTSKVRIVSYHEFTSNLHQVVRLDKEITTPLNAQGMELCIESYRKFIGQGGRNALVLSDYGKGFLTPELIHELIQISKKHNVPVVTDPKSLNVAIYKDSTVIKPNLSEGRVLFQSQTVPFKFSSFQEEIALIAQNYLQASVCHNIVMSLSQHGVFVTGKDVKDPHSMHFETDILQVADVSGAGDTLIAFLAMGLAAKLSLCTSTELGNLAAGIVCGKSGTSVVQYDEMFERLQAFKKPLQEKILSVQELAPIIKTLQNKNKKVVFTNGCFDILHAGHIDYLQKSKALGDFLVVGLNSDDSVKRLKGPVRPVQTACDRARILSSLSFVDFVVEFNDDTPLNLILELKPDMLVKGSDYNLSNTVGAAEVMSWGGSVEHIELLVGRSTTAILEGAGFRGQAAE